MEIPMSAVIVAVNAINAGHAHLSYIEHVLHEAKLSGAFDGSVESAIKALWFCGMVVA